MPRWMPRALFGSLVAIGPLMLWTAWAVAQRFGDGPWVLGAIGVATTTWAIGLVGLVRAQRAADRDVQASPGRT